MATKYKIALMDSETIKKKSHHSHHFHSESLSTKPEVFLLERISHCATARESSAMRTHRAHSARWRRSSATGIIVAPCMRRYGWVNMSRTEPKCLTSTYFASVKPLGTYVRMVYCHGYNIVNIFPDNGMIWDKKKYPKHMAIFIDKIKKIDRGCHTDGLHSDFAQRGVIWLRLWSRDREHKAYLYLRKCIDSVCTRDLKWLLFVCMI